MYFIGVHSALPTWSPTAPSPRTNHILRVSAVKWLRKALECKLTLVKAQAGSGKTTTVAQWLRLDKMDFVWLALEETDDNSKIFWGQIIRALLVHAPDLQFCLERLELPQTPLLREVLGDAIGILKDRTEKLILALDDYHLIEDPELHQLMDWFLKHLPKHVHVVILSRKAIPLQLSVLRLEGQLLELNDEQLRLHPEEVLEFFERGFGWRPNELQLNSLMTTSEGWVAGLQLIGLAVGDSANKLEGMLQDTAGTHQFFVEYFGSLILAGLPEKTQTFLLQTSIVNTLSAELCNVITDQTDSQQTLEYLVNHNIFTVALDGHGRQYRYHHLFQEFLHNRIQRSSLERSKLYSAAAQWYQKEGLLTNAIEYALEANDWALAMVCIEANMMRFFVEYNRALLGWLEKIPHEILATNPRLVVLRVSEMVERGLYWDHKTEMDSIIATLDLNKESLQTDPCLNALLGNLAVHVATICGHYQESETLCEALLPVIPENYMVIRTHILFSFGFTLIELENYVRAKQVMLEARDLTLALGMTEDHYLVQFGLAKIDFYDGNLDQAESSFQMVIAATKDSHSWSEACAHVGIGDLFLERNQLETAQIHIERSLDILRGGWDEKFSAKFVLSLARVLFAREDFAGAFDMAHHALKCAMKAEKTLLSRDIQAICARWYLQTGEPKRTESWWRALQNENIAQLGLEEVLTAARFSIFYKEISTAYKIVAAALERFTQPFATLRLRLLCAEVAHAQKKYSSVILHLNQVLPIAEHGGFIQVFLDTALMQTLLENNLEHLVCVKHVKVILGHFEESSIQNLNSIVLTTREQEVLDLIRHGYSNKEISRRLKLEIPTVKMHVARLYKKLGVNNRNQAAQHILAASG
jgi:LuxR family transcriptional regulator, maltose regulon positive regulatory protein